MKESLARSIALIGLNGQSSNHKSISKTVAMRAISASVVLDLYLDKKFLSIDEKLAITKDAIDKLSLKEEQKTVLTSLLGKKEEISYNLEGWLKAAASIGSKGKNKLEKIIFESLSEDNEMEEIPSLLGCDLFYDSAGVSLKEYRTDEKEYVREIGFVKMELLEETEYADEALCMFWLLRESSALREIFSEEELETIKRRLELYDLAYPNSLVRRLFTVRIHTVFSIGAKNYLKLKKDTMKSKVGTGISFVCPPIERSESVFIETEEGFASKEKRLEDLKERLISKGHYFTVLKEGKVPIVKINNIVYYVVPTALVVNRIPIHGVRLRRRVVL